MKSKLVSILAVLMLLLSALPAGLATAEQGAIELDADEYTNYTSGESENIVTITVEDDDLNVATDLTGDHEILGLADGEETTFTTDNANINSVSKVFDLYDGIAYFTAVSEDNTQITLNTARDLVAEADIEEATITDDVAVGSAATATAHGDEAPADAAGAGDDDDLRIWALQFDLTESGTEDTVAVDFEIQVVGDIVNASTGAVTEDQTTEVAVTLDDAEQAQFIVGGSATPVFFSGPVTWYVESYSDENGVSETVEVDIDQLRVIVARYDYDEQNTTDYEDDDGDTHQSVTITSTTDPDGLELTLTESDATSGSFEIEIALISETVKDAIDNQIAASGFSTATDTTDDLQDLTGALATTGAAGDGDDDALLAEDVLDFIAGDTDLDDDSTLDDVMARLIVVSHDDEIEVTYDDQGSGEDEADDTADVDAEAPVLSGVGPANGTYTDDETPQFTVTMVDADSGIDLDTLSMIVYDSDDNDSDVSEDVSTDPITDGYDLVFIAGFSELGDDPGDGAGAAGLTHDWTFSVKDAVGNLATTDDDDNDGADGPVGAGSLDMLQYTIDTNAPGLSSATTGTGIALDDDDDHEEMVDPAWIKVTFNEELDQDSLQASDFEVDGEEPESILFGTDIEDEDGVDLGADDATLVYLKMSADLDADATPEVEVVDDIDDLAGNDVDEDDVDASDEIPPTLTVSVDTTVGADEAEVTITMTSDEDLIQATIAVNIVNEELEADTPGSGDTSVTMVKGTGNSWEGTFEIDASTLYTIEADADDEAGVEAETNDDITFEGDLDATIVSVLDSAGTTLDGADSIEEGAVWIVTTFDEDAEYEDDSADEITITAVSLVDEDDNVIADDVASLMSDDNVIFTLAVSLTPGEYTFEITGEDSVGNEVDADADFEVVEKDPFDLVLQPGVNLVSIPGTPSGDAGALSTLFADTEVSSVITYDAAVNANGGNPWLTSTKDAASGDWSGDITVLEPGRSYFIETDASATVEVLLEDAGVEVPPSVAVYEGWNAIGYWSISGDTFADMDAYLTSIEWSVAYAYDPTPGAGWETLRADSVVADAINDEDTPSADQGEGYLVYATADGTLTP
ncbi:MAG: hypothetical protein FI727_01130 [SAR202 cluster bacterium]|nr:hypothetical protein [SAR202 cluster bacterium]